MALETPGDVPVLELRGVDIPSPGDPEVVLVRSVDWAVRPGESWLVAGQGGAGKSSVLCVAAGLVRPMRGSLRLFGRELAELPEAEQLVHRLKVGVVFGGGGRLFAQLTVRENVALPLAYHGGLPGQHGREWLEEILGKLDLMGVVDRRPRELPRRLAQRVALARALVLRPEVLLMDDPVAVPEPREERWWVDLAGTGVAGWRPGTLVVACADPRPWKAVAGHFAVVRQGGWQVLESGEELEAVLRPAEGG